MSDRKQILLKKLEVFFAEDETVEEVALFSAEELGTPMDMLRLLVLEYGPGLKDILAEYSFIPYGEEDEVWYFSSILTLETDLPKEGIPSLSQAIAKLNFYLPYGNFAISSDNRMLIYKSVTALRSDCDDETLYKDIELAADTSLLVPEQYTQLLSSVADGSLLVNDFLSMLPQ